MAPPAPSRAASLFRPANVAIERAGTARRTTANGTRGGGTERSGDRIGGQIEPAERKGLHFGPHDRTRYRRS